MLTVPLGNPSRVGRPRALRKARTAVVLGWLELGGAEWQAIQTARYLRDVEGSEVMVWGMSPPGRAAALCEEFGIPWRYYPFRWQGGRVKRVCELVRFARALRGYRPQIVLPYCAIPNIACGSVWRLTGAEVCVWNQRDEGGDLTGSRWERFAVRAASIVIANSQNGADVVRQRFRIPATRITVIANGVALSPARNTRKEWRKRLSLNESDFVGCMLANVHRLKDHETLVRAWSRVVERLRPSGTNAVLLLAGRVDDGGRVLSLVQELDLAAEVRVLGRVDDVSGLLGAVDIGVHSSRSEGCPNAVLECMASGLPVAGTDISGIREVLGPGGRKHLAAEGDAEALAERIIWFAMHPSARLAVGSGNRNRAIAEFSMAAAGRRMAQLLRSGGDGGLQTARTTDWSDEQRGGDVGRSDPENCVVSDNDCVWPGS